MTTPGTDSSEIQNLNTPPENPNMTQNEEPLHKPPPSLPKQQLEETPTSPNTQTLEIPNAQNSNPKSQDQVEEDQSNDDIEMLSPVSQPVPDRHVSTAFGVTYTRRGPNRKQQKRRAAAEKKSLKKLEVLKQTLKPIPFSPFKRNLDFSRHESLLKRIGLWDFVHLEFDSNMRKDLIAQLIATYSSTSRCSYVNGVRIGVNRADLARALNLPLKKDKVNMNLSDGFGETEELESIGFVGEVVSNWMLLHDDMLIFPEDVMKMQKLIQEGSFEKVDWATMIWLMMEKELLADPELGNYCYYASHMQCLIKGQKKELLLREEVKEEVEEDGDRDVTISDGYDDVKGSELEEHKIELSLGQDNVADLKANVENNLNENAEKEEKDFDGEGSVIGFEGNKNEQLLFFDEKKIGFEGNEKEEEENGQSLSEEKDNVGESQHLLRRCAVDGMKGMVCEGEEMKGMDCDEEEKKGMDCDEEEKKGMDCGEEENKQEVGEREEDGGDQEEEEEMEEQQQEEGGFSPTRGETLEMVTSANLIQRMEAEQVPTFRSEVHICDNDLPGEFLSSRVGTNTIPGGSLSHFGNGNKREIVHDNDLSHHSLNGGNKRLRGVGLWDNKPSSEFYMYMEQMQHLMAKVRMHYEAKEQACEELNANQQLFLDELQKRDSFIEHLQKAKYEVEHKRHEEVYRLERELFLMGNILEGYRKALKETRNEFAEYRARCPQPDEPLYKDVPGSEGLVLSVMELEKQRIKKEEEERMNRLMIEKKLKDFEGGWIAKFEEHKSRVQLMGDRLLDFENEVKHLKELLARKKGSETSECAPNELSAQ